MYRLRTGYILPKAWIPKPSPTGPDGSRRARPGLDRYLEIMVGLGHIRVIENSLSIALGHISAIRHLL